MNDQRERMVDRQIERRGIENVRVLQALRDVKRHLFVPPEEISEAYEDHPLPIGHGQTISQPYIVALMTESIDPKHSDRVLEIGTGSGYQAAVLSRLVEGSLLDRDRRITRPRGTKTIEGLGLRQRDRAHRRRI